MRVPWETLDDKVRQRTYELALERVVELEKQLWLLLGDVKARSVSCTCYPPLTRDERYHIERADALLAGYEPTETQ